MNFKLILFVSCVLVLVSGRRHNHHGGRDRHRHGHRWYRHDPFVNFEVHEPKGLTVSIVQRSPNTTFFGLELYVNRNPKLSNETHCDVCQNTTSITYGKFIVEDDEAVIKKGDILYYYVLLGDSTNVTRLHLQTTWVTASIINRCNCETASEPPQIDLRFRQTTASPDFSDRRPTFGVKPNAEEPQIPTDTPFNIDEHMNELNSEEYIPFECDLDPVTNQCRTARSDKLSQSNHDLEREVEILEAIVEQMRKTSCGSRSTTNMLRLESSNLPTNNLEQLTRVVQSSLAVNPEMKELAGGIRRIVPDRRSTSSVYFDMSSYVDKQKVLYHARMNNLKHISDYDSRHFGKSSRRG